MAIEENALVCDNFDSCSSVRWLADENRARAAGWHIWEGSTQSGKHQRVVLCPQCIGTHRTRLLSASQPLPEDQTLF